MDAKAFRFYIDFLWAMTLKEFKARYKLAVFGFLWIILNPLLQMIVIGTIFAYFVNIPNYFLFLLSGLLPWQFLSLSITKATPSFVYERSLLQKARFPREAIPLSIIFSNFLNFLISLGLFLAASWVWAPPTLNLLYLLPASVWLLTLTIAIGLMTATLNVRFRDVNFFTQSVVMLWFYATPVLYQINLVPQTLRPLFTLNPATSIFELFHAAFGYSTILTSNLITGNLLGTALIFLIAVLLYRSKHPYFMDWL